MKLPLSFRTIAALLLGGLLVAPRALAQGYSVNEGDILIANYTSLSVAKIDSVTGGQTQLGPNFIVPTDLVMDATGNLYITEWGGAIKRLALSTGAVTTVMPAGSGPSQVWGITMGSTGDLFITSRGNDAVYRVNPNTGVPTLVAQGDQLYATVGIDVLDADHLVVACLWTNRLVSVSLVDSSQTVILEGGGLDQPWGVAVAGTDIYVAGYDRKDVQRVTTGGVLDNIAATSDFPYGIAVDADGNPVVGTQGAGSSVDRISPAGAMLRSYTGSLIAYPTGVEVAKYSVVQPPVIVTQPQSQTVTEGQNAMFTVVATGGPALTYQWRFNTTELIPGATGSTLTLSNVQDADAGAYSVVVDDGATSVTSVDAVLTINHPPVPASPQLERSAGGAAKLRVAEFLGSDPDGDSLSLASVGPGTVEGGSVQVIDTWVAYTPPAAFTGNDSFGFTVSDGQGGVSGGTATVVVRIDLNPSLNVTTEPVGGTSVRIRGDGIPGRTYAVEYSESLDTPVWQALTTEVADESGRFEYVDTPPGGAPPRFYRAVEP